MRDNPQARALSRTLKTSSSLASRIADAGTDTNGDGLPPRPEDLEFIALRNVGALRIVFDDHGNVSRTKVLVGQILRQDNTLVEGESH